MCDDAPVDQMMPEKDEQMMDIDRRMKDGDGGQVHSGPPTNFKGAKSVPMSGPRKTGILSSKKKTKFLGSKGIPRGITCSTAKKIT